MLKNSYFDTVSHIIQQGVVDGLPDVAHRPLHVSWGDDLVSARSVLICGQDANFSTCYFLLVNVHSLQEGNSELGYIRGGKKAVLFYKPILFQFYI